MGLRTAAPRRPVRMTLDGEELIGDAGEPVAASIVASGRLAIARSAKFHRPRGPACMRGACDGCLARVNEEPNVMTCLVAAQDGMAIETQNVLGAKGVDLLRMTDWFFPQGFNHHELFAGVPGVQTVMQGFARRVAGLGRLPASEARTRPAVRREVDVLVAGGGPSGMAVASALAARGRRVEVVDDALSAGGSLRALGGEGRRAWAAIESSFHAAVQGGGVRLRSKTIAGAVYGDDVLLVGPEGAELCTASALVLATGAHDAAPLFEGNDVPGVMSARAAGILLASGALAGKRVVILCEGGSLAGFGEAFAREATGFCKVTAVREVVAVRGSSKVSRVVVSEEGSAREVTADALLVDLPRAPAYELAVQAGASVKREARGFVVQGEGGKVREGVWAAGEVTGVPLTPGAIAEDAARVAAGILGAQSSTSAPKSASPPASATKSNVPSKTR